MMYTDMKNTPITEFNDGADQSGLINSVKVHQTTFLSIPMNKEEKKIWSWTFSALVGIHVVLAILYLYYSKG